MKIFVATMVLMVGISAAHFVGGGVVDPAWTWGNEWGVADDWRLTHDWNRDGVIDWRDDFWLGGERPWDGNWMRADWNRDGALDWRDGWRRWDNGWGVAAVDGVLPAGAWRADGAVVREVPAAGFVDDWRHIDGPWGVPEWGYGLDGWDNWHNGWNGYGWNGWETPVVGGWEAPVVEGWRAPAVEGWRAPVVEGWGAPVVDDWAWRDGWRAAPAATKTAAKPAAAKPAASKPATTTTTSTAKKN
ncbi:unnamed protein product [Moneuplotes crassus]|uniref:Uncharacterized protein n=1 Tax=Euplotes crassus TaxID=5936 RepID=A0AAD1XR24_EUPCR|nr:unnamed protein product [Moneuplotes crassus]